MYLNSPLLALCSTGASIYGLTISLCCKDVTPGQRRTMKACKASGHGQKKLQCEVERHSPSSSHPRVSGLQTLRVSVSQESEESAGSHLHFLERMAGDRLQEVGSRNRDKSGAVLRNLT